MMVPDRASEPIFDPPGVPVPSGAALPMALVGLMVLAALCALALARRDRGQLIGDRTTTLALLAALPGLALLYDGLDLWWRGGDPAGHLPATLLLGGTLGGLIGLEALLERPPSLYLPDALYLTALGSVIGLPLLPVFLALLVALLALQRRVLRRRRGRLRRKICYQPLFLPAACAWLPCAGAALAALLSPFS